MRIGREARISRVPSRGATTAAALLVAIGLAVSAVPSAQAQTLTIIYSFCAEYINYPGYGTYCTDGRAPMAGLVEGSDGNFYGTTYAGGVTTNVYGTLGDYGTAFKITPSGTLTTLHSFCQPGYCADGANPSAGLALGGDENFYGTTFGGGSHGNNYGVIEDYGTTFQITPSGSLTTLYTFCSENSPTVNCTDGDGLSAGLIKGSDGNYYGTTTYAGANGNYGTVFRMTPGGALTTLYSFCSQIEQGNCTDGMYPSATLVQGSDGNLYGTTISGGTNLAGTVFKITTNGTLTTLDSFCSQAGCADGDHVYGALVEGRDSNFYGTTEVGGDYGCGTVFKITPGGTLTTLYSFCAQSGCADGGNPYGGLILGTDGNFYGTTSNGGANSGGTIFRMTPGGALTTLYSFCAQSGCADGRTPEAGLVEGSDGNFYGTTQYGGANSNVTCGVDPASGCGTVFKLAVFPTATLSPTNLSFPIQVLDTSSAPQTITLSNPGAATLSVSSIDVSGDFRQTNNCGSAVNAGASCVISVTFKPVVAGTVTGGLTISDNAQGSPQTILLTGTGLAMTAGPNPPTPTGPPANPEPGNPAVPLATLSSSALSFSAQSVGTSSKPQAVTLTNPSKATLAISGITASGDFSQTNTCGAALSAGAMCTIAVTFKPGATGTRTGTLSILDNAAGGSQTVTLSGTGSVFETGPRRPVRSPTPPTTPPTGPVLNPAAPDQGST